VPHFWAGRCSKNRHSACVLACFIQGITCRMAIYVLKIIVIFFLAHLAQRLLSKERVIQDALKKFGKAYGKNEKNRSYY
jgi:hypothetical protein